MSALSAGFLTRRIFSSRSVVSMRTPSGSVTKLPPLSTFSSIFVPSFLMVSCWSRTTDASDVPSSAPKRLTLRRSTIG